MTLTKIELTKANGNSWGKPDIKHVLFLHTDLEGKKLEEAIDFLNECTTGSYWWEVAK